MAFVLSLQAGDQFNVVHWRFKIVAVEVPSGGVINELGVGTFIVQATDGLNLSGEIAFQEGLRQQKAVTRLMISAPKSVKIWRGQCEFDASVALLAPVPEEHLMSGQSCCEENGRFGFGSRDFEVFRNLDEQCAGAPCHVLIYPSWASQPQAGPPKATWEATYLRIKRAYGQAAHLASRRTTGRHGLGGWREECGRLHLVAPIGFLTLSIPVTDEKR